MSEKNKDKLGTESPFFALQKIYVKNSSFESPNSAMVFQSEWKPSITLDLNTFYEPIEEGLYEAVLSIAVTAKNQEKLAFVVEVDQAAMFAITGFPQQQLDEALGSACPAVMFPYVRETIDHILLKGGFPPLMIAPVNFDALYTEKNKKSA
ncbi:protein-export chaperone SecB [Neptunomonas sp.]|uniref:protein-export chaperone SecB n=1 Tax=Neptunomonas sp. TaxID=1971898 RepID=UPI0035655550